MATREGSSKPGQAEMTESSWPQRAVLARAPEPRQAGGMMMLVSGNTRLGSSKKEVTVTAGAVSPVTLELPVLARVAGRVLGIDGPMSGVVVELEKIVVRVGSGRKDQDC